MKRNRCNYLGSICHPPRSASYPARSWGFLSALGLGWRARRGGVPALPSPLPHSGPSEPTSSLCGAEPESLLCQQEGSASTPLLVDPRGPMAFVSEGPHSCLLIPMRTWLVCGQTEASSTALSVDLHPQGPEEARGPRPHSAPAGRSGSTAALPCPRTDGARPAWDLTAGAGLRGWKQLTQLR